MTNVAHLQQLIEEALRAESAALYAAPPPKNARAYGCSVNGCPNPAYAGGYCNAHYIRVRKGKPLDLPLKHRTGGTCRECGKLVDGKGGWALCQSHFRARRRRIIRAVCIEEMGGCCAHCGGVFQHAVYDFHHLDPAGKGFSPSNAIDNQSIGAVAREAAKCILLCANCHRIEHCTE